MNASRVTRQHRPSEELLSAPIAGSLAIALVAGVFAIYGPALNFQFILDDHRFLADPRLQSSGHVWEYFTSYVWAQVLGGPLSFYRPLFVLWLRLNVILSGMSSWGWHLLSIAKHVSVAVLLGLLVSKLLRDRVAALLAGTLFAVHPAQTESVAWVTVPDPLMSAAVLGTLLLYLAYTGRVSADKPTEAERSPKKSRKRETINSRGSSSARWMIASAVTCLAALMAKETAMVLPILLFAMALIRPLDGSDGKQEANSESAGLRIRVASAFRRTYPFLGVTTLYVLLRVKALKGQFSPLTQHLPGSTVLLSAPANLWFYMKVLLWPVRSRAFADPNLAETFSFRGVLLPALGVGCAVAGMILVCVWAWRKARRELPHREAAGVESALLLGTFLLVFPVLPTLNLNVLNPGDFLHGRYTYLPLTGLMLIVATVWHMLNRGRIVLLATAGLVALAFTALTVKQEDMWKDDLTVFTMAHEMAPHNEPVAHNLSNAHVHVALGLDEAGRCDEAMPIFQQAIQRYPQDWFAWAGRGECLFKLGDLTSAEQSLRRASELSREPRVTEAWEQVRARMGLPSAPSQ